MPYSKIPVVTALLGTCAVVPDKSYRYGELWSSLRPWGAGAATLRALKLMCPLEPRATLGSAALCFTLQKGALLATSSIHPGQSMPSPDKQRIRPFHQKSRKGKAHGKAYLST